MVGPVTSAVPWVGIAASVSEVAGPPLRISGTFAARALKPTLNVLLPASGSDSATVMVRFSVTSKGAPVPLVLSRATTVKLNVPTAVGVPLITPLGLIASPVGSTPVTLKV